MLAVDVSYSMDPDEQQLQREGYMAAITSTEFMQALKHGMHGKVAVTYFEWAGIHHQQIIVPWRLIDGPESAGGFAADIARARYTRASRTSISGALLFGMPVASTRVPDPTAPSEARNPLSNANQSSVTAGLLSFSFPS